MLYGRNDPQVKITKRPTLYYHPEFGSDEKGNGTPRNPYRTYNGAIRAMPLLLDGPHPHIRHLDFA